MRVRCTGRAGTVAAGQDEDRGWNPKVQARKPTHSSTASAPHTFREVFDARDSVCAALGHDVRGAILARELLAGCVPAHGNDSLGPVRFCRQDGEQAHSIADDGHGFPRLYVGSFSREPTGSEHVRGGQEARYELVRRHLASRYQRPVRQRNPKPRRLRTADGLPVLTGRLITCFAVRARIIGSEEGSDDELARLERGDGAADLLDDATVLVAHRNRGGHFLDASIGPKV